MPGSVEATFCQTVLLSLTRERSLEKGQSGGPGVGPWDPCVASVLGALVCQCCLACLYRGGKARRFVTIHQHLSCQPVSTCMAPDCTMPNQNGWDKRERGGDRALEQVDGQAGM